MNAITNFLWQNIAQGRAGLSHCTLHISPQDGNPCYQHTGGHSVRQNTSTPPQSLIPFLFRSKTKDRKGETEVLKHKSGKYKSD